MNYFKKFLFCILLGQVFALNTFLYTNLSTKTLQKISPRVWAALISTVPLKNKFDNSDFYTPACYCAEQDIIDKLAELSKKIADFDEQLSFFNDPKKPKFDDNGLPSYKNIYSETFGTFIHEYFIKACREKVSPDEMDEILLAADIKRDQLFIEAWLSVKKYLAKKDIKLKTILDQHCEKLENLSIDERFREFNRLRS